MPLQTSLNVSPYYDDFDVDNQYYKVLFKPGVAVQARELNQLQSILQDQIEKFGDNIFKRGTVIDGCGIVFHNSMPYVKIKDVETDSTPVNVAQYNNYYVKNESSNVVAVIVKTTSGYESQAPDLNTLFVKYLNSGDDKNTATFSAGQVLKVYDTSYPIFKYKVNDGSANFSNTDTVAVISSIAIQNSTGGTTFSNASGFTAGKTIRNGVANAIIVEANTTAKTGYIVLKIKPLAADLLQANAVLWRFSNNETILDANSSTSPAVIKEVIGSDAKGSLVTDKFGKIVSITPTSYGSNYYYPPHVTIIPSSNLTSANTSSINQLDIFGQNYLTNITIAETALDPIGVGYGVTVNDGVIYQKGYFSKVLKQLVVVNKYSNLDFNKSVGFYTEESIVNSNEDPTLLDNATGTFNYTAPGADRLKLNPTLLVIDRQDAEANTEFLPIVEFSDGLPYKQNTQTLYNVIGDELAKRTYEESGNYVLDQFLLTTKDSSTFAQTATQFKIYIDPGIAYIKGYRVATASNYNQLIDKATDTELLNKGTFRASYGSYVEVRQVGGYFNFNYGDRVELYANTTQYITSGGGTISVSGKTRIGSARTRHFQHYQGVQGAPLCVYKLYIYDIVLDSGKNFSDVRSIFYKNSSGTYVGVCDTVLENGVAVLKEIGINYSVLLIPSITASKTSDAITYTYRTQGVYQSNSTGSVSISKPSGAYFPYSGVLGTSAKNEIIVTPQGNYEGAANVSGSITLSTTSSNATGTSTNFKSSFRAGDFVKVANASVNTVVQVQRVINATSMVLYSNAAAAVTAGNAKIYFPNNIPLSLNRDTRSANVDSGTGALQINIGENVSANLNIVYNVTSNNTTPSTKSIHRGIYARIITSNNAANTVGPWPVGTSDVFRLRGVYVLNAASRAVTFNSNTGVNSAADFITLTSNPFSNGDSVVYTGNTNVLSGLSNNTTYYVVSSNTTGIKLSTTRGGSTVGINAISTSETHTVTGSPLYFTETTNGVSDVTDDYYIDHNQSDDFLDISYLYRKPRRTALSTNDVVLVKFDAFKTSTGPKTISSYAIDDTLTLSSLVSTNTSINTMEIPEVFGLGGKYYDLRDQIDYRPSVEDSIPRTTDSSNTQINNPSTGTLTSYFNANTQVNSTADFITITNNPYTTLNAPLFYNVNSGTTTIGLSNGTIYYVSFQNTSGVAVSSTVGGANVNLTANTVSELHTLKGLTTLPEIQNIEWKFPVVDTDISANITYYVPRNDRVVLDINGEFLHVKGVPNVVDGFPPEPRDSFTLQYLKIPPYPSLPAALSQDMITVVDTKIANEKYTNKRYLNYRVSTPISQDQINRIQVKGYKMADISALEKRIRDLEYYVSFTLAETIAKGRFIGSSANTALDRYKFGYFVDPFSNYDFSDKTNPEYYATIEDNMLSPYKKQFNLEFKYADDIVGGETIATLDFDEYTIVAQTGATYGPIETGTTTDTTGDVPTANTITANTDIVTPQPDPGGSGQVDTIDDTTGEVVVTTITQDNAVVIQQHLNRSGSDVGNIYEDFYYTFSELSGPARFYILSRGNYVAAEVSQSTTENGTWTTTTTSATASIWTTSDYTNNTLSDIEKLDHNSGLYKVAAAAVFRRQSFGPAGGWIRDGFKLLWTHNPANGKYVRIRVYKGQNHDEQGRTGIFVYKMFYLTDSVNKITRVVADPGNFDYIGIVNSIEPPSFTVSSYDVVSSGFASYKMIPIADSQIFKISASGLKPNTKHKFYVDDEDKTSVCDQIRASTTYDTDLISDSNGVINFEYYYDAGINEATSEVAVQNKLIRSEAGQKRFIVKSADGNSYAAGTITIKSYVTAVAIAAEKYSALNVPSSNTETLSDSTNNNLSKTVDSNADINNVEDNIVDVNLTNVGSGILANTRRDGAILNERPHN